MVRIPVRTPVNWSENGEMPAGSEARRLVKRGSNPSGAATRRLVAVLLLVSVVAPGKLSTLETDQHCAWSRPLADSTDAVNARFNLELERAIASFPTDRPPRSCHKISVAYRKRMRSLLLHEIQVWAWNSKLVDRIPNGGDEQREYRRTNLYSNHPLIDTGTWMPFIPTIKVAGVRMGTDKLALLVSSGWTYCGEYRKGLARGETPEEAERRAVRRGTVEVSPIRGKMASGVLAIPDIEASYAGIHFYRDLCDVEDPILKLESVCEECVWPSEVEPMPASSWEIRLPRPTSDSVFRTAWTVATVEDGW